MYRMARNIAARPVGTPEAKTWKSRVNATICHVRSRFGSLNHDVSLIWPAESDCLLRLHLRHSGSICRCSRMRPIEGESFVKFIKQSLSLFLSCCLILATAPGGLAAQADQSAAQLPVQAAKQSPEQLQQLAAPDRIVSRCSGGTDPRSSHLSRPSCGSRPVATAAYRSQE